MCSAIQARRRARNSASAGESRKSIGHSETGLAAAAAAARRRRRTSGRRAARAAGRRGRCSPTCSPSRRAPARRSRRRCARRARCTPWPRARRCGLRRARGSSTAHAGYSAALNAPSIRQRASARRCCTAWNVPIGDAVLPPFLRVGDRDVEHAPHEPDQIGARERQTQRRPGVEIGAREAPGLAGNREQRRAGRERADRAREVGAVARAVALHAREAVAVAVGDQDVRRDGTAARHRRRRGAPCPSPGPTPPRRRSGRARRRPPRRRLGRAPARRARSAARIGPANGTSATASPSASAMMAASTPLASGAPSPVVLAQLEPARVAHGLGEALAPLARRRGRPRSAVRARVPAAERCAAARPVRACPGCPSVRMILSVFESHLARSEDPVLMAPAGAASNPRRSRS